MKNIKIGFILAKNNADIQSSRPLSYGYLKAFLHSKLEESVVMDFLENTENLSKYDIIAISSTSQDYAVAINTAREVKKFDKNIVTIIGGHHVTYLPETLAEEFDIGVLGEGEQTFYELVRHIQSNGFDLDHEGLKSVQSIVFKSGDRRIINPKRSPIEPLDVLPHPHRDAGDEQYLFTSRGCPYRCAFCSSSAFWEKTRTFSADYVVEEIESILKKFPATKHIPIQDDLFIVNRSRFRKIISMIEERNIHRRVSFGFSVRANLVDDELCELIKRVNVARVAFGAESACDRVLSVMNKKVTVAQNQNALDALYKHSIPVLCSFIVGIPSETEAEVRATYEFLLKNILEEKLSVDSAVNILMPMTGTEMWDNAVERGLISPLSFDWNKLAVFASYRASNISDFSDWVELRKRNDSLYLNEETLPQDRLYEIMAEYETKLKAIDEKQRKSKKMIGNRIRRYFRKLANSHR